MLLSFLTPLPHTHTHRVSVSFYCIKGQPKLNVLGQWFIIFRISVVKLDGSSWFLFTLVHWSRYILEGTLWPHLHVWQLVFAVNWGQLGSPSCDLIFTSHLKSENKGYRSSEGLVSEVAETLQLHYVKSKQITEPAQMTNSHWPEVCGLGLQKCMILFCKLPHTATHS